MIGKYPAKLDDKNRMFLPSRLREDLTGHFFVTLGVNCGRRCLTAVSYTHLDVYKRQTWE